MCPALHKRLDTTSPVYSNLIFKDCSSCLRLSVISRLEMFQVWGSSQFWSWKTATKAFCWFLFKVFSSGKANSFLIHTLQMLWQCESTYFWIQMLLNQYFVLFVKTMDSLIVLIITAYTYLHWLCCCCAFCLFKSEFSRKKSRSLVGITARRCPSTDRGTQKKLFLFLH